MVHLGQIAGKHGRKKKPAMVERLSKFTQSGPVMRLARERAEREPVFADAVLSWPQDQKAVGAALNVSRTGVLVRFRSRAVVPDVVTIRVQAHGIQRQARITRRDGLDIALSFID